ncbi:recombinase RarA, partial [Priestia megaterium]
AHYKGAENLGRGVEYQYPHDFDNGWVLQQYLPDRIKNKQYFHPKQNGQEKYFSKVFNRLETLKKENG